MTGFAARLRTLRHARGFRTAKSFAEALGIDQNTYTRYERGEAEPNLAMLDRIWQELGLAPNELFGEGHAPRPGVADGASLFQARRRLAHTNAAAWHLAESYSHHADAAGCANTLARLRRAGALYRDLIGDPFATIAAMAASSGLDRMAAATRDELAAMMASYAEAVREAELDGRRTRRPTGDPSPPSGA
jgi:transcriptional regulator with XRE-family HTH domain